ncbi:MAG TPA: MarR family transcriptional regulator [Candidatus Dormibacteraeota bacterium]|nr:MarR family transcriptional regulator [Candidatus Dormibacteraeota bacterium]
MSQTSHAVSSATIRELARFRYQLRRFLRFSEKAARQAGLTPQQHQLLLGVAGHTGRGWATISELSEFLQERHNAVVGLVDRAQQAGLVSKELVASDRRLVRVQLTARGRNILNKLSALHRRELARFRLLSGLFSPSRRTENGLETQARGRRPINRLSR